MIKNERETMPMSLPRIKRFFDIVYSLSMLVITCPLFIAILVAIFMDHVWRGKVFAPLFYVETRVTQGRPFKFVKFNVFKPRVIESKKKNNEFINTKSLEHDGFSLTSVGRIVQLVYLDELPQLISILKGDMTTVGPRPVNSINYKKGIASGLTAKTIFRAGWTGSYQSHKGESGVGQEEYDTRYIDFCRNNPGWRILLNDIKIILRTVLVMLRAKGY